ncbi:MAG: Ku protein [Firmicutes bacterium]|nr:Ku protein [Bacillota bacterium]
MRAMWKGSLGFGLVNIPVRLFAATASKELKFRYLHAPCHTPLEYRKTCPTCEREVPWEEIARGYEYSKNNFVVLSEEETKAAAGKKDGLIEISDFVNMEEIDPLYFQKGYYLVPDGPSARSYALLQRAMQETGKIAVATLTLRTKESLAVVRTYGKVLSLSTMFFPDEVRPWQGLPDLPQGVEVREKELQMAKELIASMVVPFTADKYQDRHREALLELIAARVEGKEVAVAPAPEREKVVDLLAALQASVEKAQAGKKNTAAEKNGVSPSCARKKEPVTAKK